MASTRVLVLLSWSCLLPLEASTCVDSEVDGEDGEEICALQTHTSRTSYALGDFDKTQASGYFAPKGKRYTGKKIFFSKNSCATVLFCLKAVYSTSDDTSAWGRQAPAERSKTLLEFWCKRRPLDRICWGRERRKGRLVKPGDPKAILGPQAHAVCKEANFYDADEGCSQWMIPFMNQLALTLGSSSESYNLFLDYGSSGIEKCFKPKYNQKCVNQSLKESVEQAEIFLFFPDWYCGPSCAIEVEIAQKVKETNPHLQLIELDWDTYYALFSGFDTPPNPSENKVHYVKDLSSAELQHQWEAGSAAAVYILQKLQLASNRGKIPDGQCAITGENGCASGKLYTNTAADGCLFKSSLSGVVGGTLCDACKDAVKALYNEEEKKGAFGTCDKAALDLAPECLAADAETAELTDPICESVVYGACDLLQHLLKDDKHLDVEAAQKEVCEKGIGVCPGVHPTRDFCGCLPAGQCSGFHEEKFCCSGVDKENFFRHCLRDFHQADLTPYICT